MSEQEKLYKDLEIRERLQSVAMVSSWSEWTQNGLTNEQLDIACLEVSDMVLDYVEGHGGEMLLKDPETIKDQFLRGESLLMVGADTSGLVVVGHGTNYVNFEKGEDRILGMQVIEVGTVIVNDRFRGQGWGKLGVKYLSEMALNGYQDVLRLATVKQAVTARVFDDAGIIPVSFYNYPYLSFLTCTCENSSERCGYTSCQFRRANVDATSDEFSRILNPKNRVGKIPCTLVISDLEKASKFEETCRNLHGGMGETPIEPGQISIEVYERAGSFFERISIVAQKSS